MNISDQESLAEIQLSSFLISWIAAKGKTYAQNVAW